MSIKGNFARSTLCSATTSVDFGSYSSMVSVCCARGASCCAKIGRRAAPSSVAPKKAAVVRIKAAVRRKKCIGPPEKKLFRADLLQIFPRLLLRTGNVRFLALSAKLIFWTQRRGHWCLVVQRFCLPEEAFQIRIACLGHIGEFDVAQIAACAFEKLGRIFERRAARKTERDMLFPDAQIKKRAIPLKNGNAPRIHGFARGWHCLFHQSSERINHLDERGIFARHIKID